MTTTTLTITERRSTPTEPPIYGAWNPADPTDAMMIDRLLKRRHVRAATVTVDFSPAGSGALNAVCRSEQQARSDAMERSLRKIRGWLDREASRCEAEAAKPNQFLTMTDAYRADAKNYRAVIEEIDAALPAQSPTPEVA